MKSHRVRLVAFAAVSLAQSSCSAIDKVVAAASGGSCDGPTTISATQSVTGKTDGGRCKSPDGNYSTLYAFTAAQQTNVEVAVTPNGFQPWLGVFTASGARMAQTNTSPWRLRLFLAPGSYQFAVAPVGSKDGTFTFSTTPADVSTCLGGPGTTGSYADMAFAMKGVAISGALTNADCGAGNGGRSDGYQFFGSSVGSSLTVTFAADRAANIEFLATSGNTTKSLNAAGTTTLSVPGTGDPNFRFFVSGIPGTGAINYTVTIN